MNGEPSVGSDPEEETSSTEEESSDPNVLFPTLREDDLEDSNFTPPHVASSVPISDVASSTHVASSVPVPDVASSEKVPTQLPGPVLNLQPADHVLNELGEIHSRPKKPHYNLRPRDPQWALAPIS